jgi:hypothetical protein
MPSVRCRSFDDDVGYGKGNLYFEGRAADELASVTAIILIRRSESGKSLPLFE